MFKAMAKTNYKDKELLTSYQNFNTGTIQIMYDKNEYTCDMFQEEDGDIGFIFNNEKFYFTYMEML